MSSANLNTPIASVMTNKRRVSALKSLGIVSINDALTYYPFRVTDPVPLRSLHEAKIGEKMAFAAQVRGLRVSPMARRGFRLEALVDDSEFASSHSMPGSVASLVFFSYKKSYIDWVAMRLHEGSQIVVAGEPSVYNNRLQFTHPDLLTVAPMVNADATFAMSFDDAANSAQSPASQSQSQQRPYRASPQTLHPTAATSPTGLKYDAGTMAEALACVCRPRPVYHATSRISSEHIHDSILQCMDMLRDKTGNSADVAAASPPKPENNPANNHVTPYDEFAVPQRDRVALAESLRAAIPDIIPEKIRAQNGLIHRAEAFVNIHDPANRRGFDAAIRTLRYEEALICQTSLLQSRQHARESAAEPCADIALRDAFIGSLPFELTQGQHDVITAISGDMSRDYPMQRLLQGEVGSGKTVVAVAAMLQAVSSGRQSVLVAPTQVLAEQHYEMIRRMVDGVDGAADIPVVLLTGGMKLAARRRALATASSGEPCIVVATHAAFSKTFQAPNLALVVIDEQHRFGVEQRESLQNKAQQTPHLLVMTATPIPRTAAMTWFGDLDISWLTELPGGRKPIRTFVIPESNGHTMGSMFAHIRARIDAGERAYVVCPRIDADDDTPADDDAADGIVDGHHFDDAYDLGESDEQRAQRPPLHSVKEIAERLAALPQFAGISFATLTGRDDDETKRSVMASFADGTTPILVATTVIEVGVDVPQASCIVIFDADRYGLSQLHQLRGRVGRGGTHSWAFLVSRAAAGTPAAQRLVVIEGTLDGAQIAQADLEFRGAGDVLGDAQSGGKSSLKLLRVVKDVKLIEQARSDAQRLLADDVALSGEVQLAGAVLDFTRGNETFLTSN